MTVASLIFAVTFGIVAATAIWAAIKLRETSDALNDVVVSLDTIAEKLARKEQP